MDLNEIKLYGKYINCYTCKWQIDSGSKIYVISYNFNETESIFNVVITSLEILLNKVL